VFGFVGVVILKIVSFMAFFSCAVHIYCLYLGIFILKNPFIMSKPKVVLSVQHPVTQRLLVSFQDVNLYHISFDTEGNVCIFTSIIIETDIRKLSSALDGSGFHFYISSSVDGAFSLSIRFFQ